MKKLLYLFIATTLLISCESNEDEEDMSNSDPIIGTWQLESAEINDEEFSTECEKQTTVTFLENGVVNAISFFEDNNGCESETETSSWRKISDSIYRITYDTEDEFEDINLIFSQNNTIFTISVSETFDGMTFTSVITYKKI
ncbi:lipocalin family protein [uncultured Polaribacter sp.]|uniref:lipocalin family protein n=1 Tax=uncultured Polaribacter sp. TaxID=174711 RepID=UPI00261E7581|nr:lipocalin family protein [uncultured Polaribacter sp.]